MRALSKRPDERFQTMDEFARALGATELRASAAEIVRAADQGNARAQNKLGWMYAFKALLPQKTENKN
jgi:TPR repeat protein